MTENAKYDMIFNWCQFDELIKINQNLMKRETDVRKFNGKS